MARHQNYLQDNVYDPEADKMKMYLESRGMIPINQSQGVSQNQDFSRRRNQSDRNEAFGHAQSGVTSQESTTKWPPSRYPYSNHPSLDSPREKTNEKKDNVTER